MGLAHAMDAVLGRWAKSWHHMFVCCIFYICSTVYTDMSLKKHSDYSSYLTNLKYVNLSGYLSDKHFNAMDTRLTLVQNTVAQDYMKKTETVYISLSPISRGIGAVNVTILPTIKGIGLDGMITIITQPTDLTSDFFSIFKLPADASIPDGTLKTIINTAHVSQTQLIYVYCMNTNTNTSGFSNAFNCYVFPSARDILELCWVTDKQTWFVKSCGGHFINYNL